MATQYKGKYPDRIKTVTAQGGTAVVTTNDGRRFKIAASSTSGEMPRLNESISAYHATPYAARMQNPAPRKTRISRTDITEQQYINRPSQITRKAPTKRAQTRRQTHLDSGLPPGYYPNPVKQTIIPESRAAKQKSKLFAIGLEGKEPFAYFVKKKDAVEAANAYADALNQTVYIK